MTAVLAADLTDAECGALVECERAIERGLKTFVEVGRALAAIRDGQLYRTDYATFEAYCDERWTLSRPRAYQLIEAAAVVSTTVDTGYRPPSNERQARELARVPGDERSDVWREANERSNGRPTAATVREVVRERQAPPPITERAEAQAAPSTLNGQSLPPEPKPTPVPERPKPPKWDPEERRQHEAEVQRIQTIEAARRESKTIVTTVLAAVVTVVGGSRLGVRGLVTRDMICDLRKAIDLLEGELANEE